MREMGDKFRSWFLRIGIQNHPKKYPNRLTPLNIHNLTPKAFKSEVFYPRHCQVDSAILLQSHRASSRAWCRCETPRFGFKANFIRNPIDGGWNQAFPRIYPQRISTQSLDILLIKGWLSCGFTIESSPSRSTWASLEDCTGMWMKKAGENTKIHSRPKQKRTWHGGHALSFFGLGCFNFIGFHFFFIPIEDPICDDGPQSPNKSSVEATGRVPRSFASLRFCILVASPPLGMRPSRIRSLHFASSKERLLTRGAIELLVMALSQFWLVMYGDILWLWWLT